MSRAEDAMRSMVSSDAAAEAGAAKVMERADATSARLPVTHLSLEARVAVLEAKQDANDRRLTRHGAVIDDHAPRIERLERIVGEVLARLAALDLRLSKVEARLLLGGGLIYVATEVLMRTFGK